MAMKLIIISICFISLNSCTGREGKLEYTNELPPQENYSNQPFKTIDQNNLNVDSSVQIQKN